MHDAFTVANDMLELHELLARNPLGHAPTGWPKDANAMDVITAPLPNLAQLIVSVVCSRAYPQIVLPVHTTDAARLFTLPLHGSPPKALKLAGTAHV
jgi:hypothetical protein